MKVFKYNMIYKFSAGSVVSFWVTDPKIKRVKPQHCQAVSFGPLRLRPLTLSTPGTPYHALTPTSEQAGMCEDENFTVLQSICDK